LAKQRHQDSTSPVNIDQLRDQLTTSPSRKRPILKPLRIGLPFALTVGRVAITARGGERRRHMRPALIALLLMIFASLAALAFVVLLSPVGAQPVETLTHFVGDT